MTNVLLVKALAVTIALSANVAYAQSQAIHSSIRGRITDPGKMVTTFFPTCRLAPTR
jgi:hypothetical protein